MFTITAMHGLRDWRAGEPGAFPFLSRVLDLPPLVAQAAFDAVRGDHRLQGGPMQWSVQVPAGSLELAGPGWVSPPPRTCYWSYRAVPGTIRPASWPPTGAVAVRLELLPWSDIRTALGLGVRRVPFFASPVVYADVASAALDVLRDEMQHWALHELFELDDNLDTPA